MLQGGDFTRHNVSFPVFCIATSSAFPITGAELSELLANSHASLTGHRWSLHLRREVPR
jgi:hypothetical protein